MASKTIGRAVTAAVLIAAGLSCVQGAEKVRWEDLQQRVYSFGECRSVNVITRDGHKHHSRGLSMTDDHLSLLGRQNIEEIARQDVLRVEIRQRKRHYQRIGTNVEMSVFLPLASLMGFVSGCDAGICIWGLLLTPPVWAYTAASTAVFLAADGVAFLLPSRVFDIVQ